MIPLHDDNPTQIRPIMTIVLIVLCVLVFLVQIGHPSSYVIRAYGLVPAALFSSYSQAPSWPGIPVPATLTVFTSMFMHGDWMHLIGNMLFLWIFGNNVEDAMGHFRFILFYLLCGIIAAMSFALPNSDSLIPMVGASGAISGVLGAYLLLYPRARVLVLIYVAAIRIPAVWVLGMWFVFQLLSTAAADASQGGVAWGAHIGGFVAGMVLIPLFKNKAHPLFAKAHTFYRRD